MFAQTCNCWKENNRPIYVTYCNLSLNHESQIDYIVTSSPNSILSYQVLQPDINFSDHFPLLVKLSLPVDKSSKFHHNKSTHKYLRWDKADTVSYYYYSGALLSQILSQIDTMLEILQTCCATDIMCGQVDAIYNDIVTALNTAASLYVPKHSKNYYKFWWNEELKILKEDSVTYNKLWVAAGKPRSGHIFDKRQTSRLKYRQCIREAQSKETVSYTNDLHEALMRKNSTVFWKCWQSKFEVRNNCTEVDGCVNRTIIAEKFVEHFSSAYSYNNNKWLCYGKGTARGTCQ